MLGLSEGEAAEGVTLTLTLTLAAQPDETLAAKRECGGVVASRQRGGLERGERRVVCLGEGEGEEGGEGEGGGEGVTLRGRGRGRGSREAGSSEASGAWHAV